MKPQMPDATSGDDLRSDGGDAAQRLNGSPGMLAPGRLQCGSSCIAGTLRALLRPSDLDLSLRFYRDVLGLAVYREFGPADHPGMVFFLGQGLLEVSGHAAGPAGGSVMIWIQVRDVRAEHARLAAAGVPVIREPVTEPWGLAEMWIEDPDGIRIVLVEVPPGHPLRRDPRPS